MTVVRISDGSLLVHSPTQCDRRMRAALAELGPVAHIVAPNGMHDLFLEDYAAAFPQARIWIPPGLSPYFSKISQASELPADITRAPWFADLTCVLVQGIPRLNEAVFFHPRSRSLIVADLFFNVGPECSIPLRIAARLGGFYRKLATPVDIRWFLVRNKEKFRKSMQEIRRLPFQNIMVGHGNNVMGAGQKAFERATAWAG